jgi:esterase
VLAASVQALAGFPQSVLDRRFDGKTLFFYGANSTYVQPEHLDTIRRLFPSARLRALADAGHWLHVDQHQRFLEVVAAFLKESHSG